MFIKNLLKIFTSPHIPTYGLPIVRSVVLLSAIGFVFLVAHSEPWVNEQLLLKDTRTALEDSLQKYISYQVIEKNIPGLSVSLVSDQRTVFEDGFGFVDLEKQINATPYTVYRAGVLAQLFTTIAVLQRVELGYLDLDAPVTTYLPNFNPINPYGLPLTLRQILSHQSGLVTEPPIGHSFDMVGASLEESVASLNTTSVVYPPETFTKFSNAGFGVAGFILERSTEKPYHQHMRAILDRMSLMRTSFSPRLDLKGKLAPGHTRHIDGRLFRTSVYELGNSPAGNIYTTVNDLGTFLKVIHAGGESDNGRILNTTSLEQMWTIQLSTARKQLPFGLGFALSQMQGEQRASLNNSFQGYSSRVDILPESRLGIALLSNSEHAEIALKQIADYALRLLLAEQNERPLPSLPRTSAPDSSIIAQAIGYYEDTSSLYISALDNELYLYKDGGKYLLKQVGDSLIVDDIHAFGTILLADGLSIELDKTLYVKKDPLLATQSSDRYDNLLGAYGFIQSPFSIIERQGSLYAQYGWLKSYPLREASVDSLVLPADGLYGGEAIIIVNRDEYGRADRIKFANMLLDRIPEEHYVFQLESITLGQQNNDGTQVDVSPPATLTAHTSSLVDLTMIDPLLNLEVRNASDDNLFRSRLYNEARVFLQRPIAEAIFRIQRKVRRLGYDLVLYDAYRPWRVSSDLWSSIPDSLRYFQPHPSEGSCQNRGAAVSLSLFELNSRSPMAMPTEYDVFSTKAHADYPLLPASYRRNRDFLRYIMEAEGFRASPYAWWHFTHQSCQSYPVTDVLFEEINQAQVDLRESIYTIK